MESVKIAFICTGNSARSQMAEGLTRAYGVDYLVVQSAGTSPMGVAWRAIQVMSEIGIDISHHTSKDLRALDNDLDYAITLCDHAARRCPVLPAEERLHWPLPDPYALADAKDSLDGFRQVREMLKARIAEFLCAHDLLRNPV